MREMGNARNAKHGCKAKCDQHIDTANRNAIDNLLNDLNQFTSLFSLNRAGRRQWLRCRQHRLWPLARLFAHRSGHRHMGELGEGAMPNFRVKFSW